jgi:hypothetical protein
VQVGKNIITIEISKPNDMDQKIKTLQEIKNSNLHTILNIKINNEYSAGMYTDRELHNQPDNNIAVFKNDTLIFVIKGKAIAYCWISQNNDLLYLVTDSVVEYGVGAPAKQIGIFRSKTMTDEIIYEISDFNELYLKDIQYAAFDQNIYIYNFLRDKTKVFRLDLENKMLIPTNYRGIYFSPDGEYYIDNSFIENPVTLYKTKTNEEIWSSRTSGIAHLYYLLSWHITENEKCFFISGIYGVAKINCENGNLVKYYEMPEVGKIPYVEKGSIIWK